MMIKRYANRKLYDTTAGRYVTLEELGEAIRRGEEVTVRDHASGADLTALTLMQVMFEREKKVGGLLPKAILTGLIQAGSSAMGGLREGLTTLLANSQDVEAEIRRRLKILMEDGLIAMEEFQRFSDLLVGARFREQAPAGGAALSEEEVENLLQQIDDLERQIAEEKARQRR